ncbi:glycosyltransferase family 9 protein, partial [bacterium]|nr:glycosyltransferase family 9 protein [bacterium]
YKLEKGNYILIHPVASPEWETKRWPPERFAELADILIEKGEKIVFIGKGREEIEKIIKKMKNKPLNLSDETNISQLIFIIKNSKVVITTDSAPLHIGAASRVKTIGIFGPTDPKRHCPPGVDYIYKKVECSPCYRKKCDKMICMKEIKVKDILEKIYERNKL